MQPVLLPEVKEGQEYPYTNNHKTTHDEQHGTTSDGVDIYNFNEIQASRILRTRRKMKSLYCGSTTFRQTKFETLRRRCAIAARENNVEQEGKGIITLPDHDGKLCPGELIFGADSRTTTVQAHSVPVSAGTDLLYGMARPPGMDSGDVKFNLTGKAAGGRMSET